MAALRESALLPTVKCSSCGSQVPISLMGDHICSGPAVASSRPMDRHRDGDYNHGHFNRQSGKGGHFPAPVDTIAANRAYMNQGGQLTPVSQAGNSRNASPMNQTAPAIPEHPDEHSAQFLSRPGGGRISHGDGSAGLPRPSSPGKPLGDALRQRMNGIVPGPFDASRRSPAMGEDEYAPRSPSPAKWDGRSSLDEPQKDRNLYGMSHSSGIPSNVATPKQPKRSDYEGFGPPPTPRSAGMTLEPLSIPEAGSRPTMPSEASGRAPLQNVPASLLPPMNVPGGGRRPSLSPDTSRRPPPRSGSLIPQRDRNHSLVNLAAEFGSNNPYHAPSESTSSGYSTFSAQSHSSSHTSLSEGFEDGSFAKMDELHPGAEKLRPGSDSRIDPQASLRSPSPSSPYPISPGFMRSGAEGGYRPYVPSSSTSLVSPRGDVSPARAMTPPLQKNTQDPPNVSSRGECKACHQAITGKSISSADGRLTGKYHKACFVCTTCSEPFSSAEFYVLDDRPYCEQHYHRLNGSLCGGCGRGIEGEYVEDESDVKHHLECFCCLDCRVSLSSGYFEVEGRAFCERCALRRTQPPPLPRPTSPANANGMPYGQRPYSPGPGSGPGPGPRPHGPPGPYQGRPLGPPGQGQRPRLNSSAMMPPGMQRGRPPPGGSPGHLGPNMSQGQRPMMNKRMTRLGTVKRSHR